MKIKHTQRNWLNVCSSHPDLQARVGKEGRLYGSITSQDIASA